MNRSPDSVRLGYVPALDGLRAFAVLNVMAVHAVSSFWKGGWVGLDVFFVLSGFLITYLLAQEWQRTGGIRFKRFYSRRALKLFPALFALLIVYLVSTYLFLDRLFPQYSADLRSDALIVLLYASNWTLALGWGRPQLLGHAWALSIEAQYYLLWPLALTVLLRLLRSRRWLVVTLLLGAGAAYLHRMDLLAGGASFERLHFGLDTRADPLLIGSALGVMLSEGRTALSERVATLLTWAVRLAALALIALCFRADWDDPSTFYLVIPLVSVLTCFCIAAVLLRHGSVLTRVLESPPLVWVGKISYGLYLWHFPIFRVMQAMGIWGPLVLTLGGGVTFAVATVSYYRLELPFLMLKARWQDTPKAPTLQPGTGAAT